MIRIPFGKTESYAAIGRRIGSPYSARAIGQSANRNKIAIIIPCHRVVGSNGKMVGYAYGIETKIKLLEHESAVAESL